MEALAKKSTLAASNDDSIIQKKGRVRFKSVLHLSWFSDLGFIQGISTKLELELAVFSSLKKKSRDFSTLPIKYVNCAQVTSY